jgi:hypothetical protein
MKADACATKCVSKHGSSLVSIGKQDEAFAPIAYETGADFVTMCPEVAGYA